MAAALLTVDDFAQIVRLQIGEQAALYEGVEMLGDSGLFLFLEFGVPALLQMHALAHVLVYLSHPYGLFDSGVYGLGLFLGMGWVLRDLNFIP